MQGVVAAAAEPQLLFERDAAAAPLVRLPRRNHRQRHPPGGQSAAAALDDRQNRHRVRPHCRRGLLKLIHYLKKQVPLFMILLGQSEVMA